MPTLVNNQVGAHLPVTHTYQTRSLVVKERLNLKPRRRLVLKTPRISATRLRKFVHGGSGMGDPWTMEDADGITRGCSWGDPTPMTPAVLNSGQMVQTSITVRDTTLEWVRGGKVKARACGKSVTKRPSAKAAPDGVGGWRNTRKHPAIGVYHPYVQPARISWGVSKRSRADPKFTPVSPAVLSLPKIDITVGHDWFNQGSIVAVYAQRNADNAAMLRIGVPMNFGAPEFNPRVTPG
ncbi:hypothetical protein C8R43DRAFT_959236 [Mycena crocata]|nr:hypothetical protein C8R43DRAFT_959236 [Mycena crocata]